MNFFSNIILFLFLQLRNSYSEDSELIAVTALIRHGARIPISSYPTDPYKNYTWPFAVGDLTNEGIDQLYKVGRFLKKIYVPHFLSKDYKPEEIYSHSVDFDRCLMSGEATMAGLYPPTKSEAWNKHNNWQPIPMHATPRSQDIMTDMLDPCPSKIAATISVIEQSPFYREIMNKYGPLFDFITEKAGQTVNLTSLYPFFDTLFSEKKVGLTLPEWAEKIYRDLFPLVISYTKLNSLSPVERKIQTGPLVTRILKQFDNAINKNDFGTIETVYRKFMAYFSTEWMLYDFTYGIGLESIGIPEYGAFFLIELRKQSGKYYVQIWYKKDTHLETPAVPWKIVGQNFTLDYDKFKEIVAPLKTNTTEWVPLCDNFVHAKTDVVAGVPVS